MIGLNIINIVRSEQSQKIVRAPAHQKKLREARIPPNFVSSSRPQVYSQPQNTYNSAQLRGREKRKRKEL